VQKAWGIVKRGVSGPKGSKGGTRSERAFFRTEGGTFQGQCRKAKGPEEGKTMYSGQFCYSRKRFASTVLPFRAKYGVAEKDIRREKMQVT